MGLRRFLLSAGLSGLALAGGPPAAFAQADMCASLEARLVSLQQGESGTPGDYASYDAAVNKQRRELDGATAQARTAGCIGGFLIFQRRDPHCGRLMATIDRMRANLTRLAAQRDRLAGFGGFRGDRERDEVLRELAFNDCGPQYAAYGRRPGGFFETLFGRGRGWGDDGLFAEGQFGTYRTLCVRTCDGYYFPISFSTVQAKFAQDEQICQAMCPGSDVSIYIHRNPGEDSEAMVSLAGEPYASQPNAFKYRKEYDKACTCRSATAIAGLPVDGATLMTPIDPSAFRPPPPLPEERPHQGEDPETLANRAGTFVPKPVVARGTGTPVAGLDPSGKAIRVVGPAFYVAQ